MEDDRATRSSDFSRSSSTFLLTGDDCTLVMRRIWREKIRTIANWYNFEENILSRFLEKQFDKARDERSKDTERLFKL